MIVKGAASRYADPEVIKALRRDYARKYDYSPDWSDNAGQIFFEVTPVKACSWKPPKMYRNMAQSIFKRRTDR